MKGFIVALLFVVVLLPLSAQNETSFKEVTKHLQSDGDFYLYLSTKDFVNSLHKRLEELHDTVFKLAATKKEQQQNIENGFILFKKLLNESGINEISGLGISAKKDSSGLFNNILFLHHYPKDKLGKLWTSFGKAPHPLEELSLLPKDTVLASFQDFDSAGSWQWISEALLKSGIPEVKQGILKFLSDSSRQGIDINKILLSLDEGVGIVITMDENKKIKIPAGQGKLIKINEPGIMLLFKVKDDTIFNLIQSKLMPGNDPKKHLAKRSDSDGLKTLQLKFGIPFIPGPAVIVENKDYLIIASNQKMVDIAMAVKNGKKKGLTASDDFKSLSKGIPLEGNGFFYVSPRVKKIIASTLQESMKQDGCDQNDALTNMMFFDAKREYATFSVYSMLKDGYIVKSKSTTNAATTLVTTIFIAPTGIMAGMLLPALSMARESARKISCANNLKQIGLACRMYSNTHDAKFPSLDGAAGLDQLRSEGFLENSKCFTCPSTSDEPAPLGAGLTEKSVSYIYFGGFNENDSVDIPLAFDKPSNHERFINILFLDGHVKGFAGDFNTCADVVEFLISNNKYSAATTDILRNKAAEADKKLEE